MTERNKGRRRFLYGKGALLAGLAIGGPAIAAALITSQKSDDGYGARVMSAVHAVADRVGMPVAGKGGLVSSAQELRRALDNAKNGDVIRLAAGAYPEITLTGINKDGEVTITSADPARPAIIKKLMIRQSSGLTLRGLELASDPMPPIPGRPGGEEGFDRRAIPFTIANSQRITLDRLEIHGPEDNIEEAFHISAVMVRGSTQIVVSNCHFHTLWNGLSIVDLDGIVVRNNEFHNIRTDGVHGGDVSNLEIAGNIFTDFHPYPGDHPDGIQLWSTPKGVPLNNISIHDNIVVRGSGGKTQGIFIRDVKNSHPFHNVEIRDNLIIGTMYNGIAIYSVDGAVIEGNRLVNYPDFPKVWIGVNFSKNIKMRNNSAALFTIVSSTVDQSSNKTERHMKLDVAGEVSRWLNAKPGRRRADSILQAKLTDNSPH